MKRTNLLDLPILPIDRDDACGTNRIGTAFVAERKKISCSTSLKSFIERWKPIWLLSGPSESPLKSSVLRLLNLDFDLEKMVIKIHQEHPEGDQDFDVLCDLLLPAPALEAFFISTSYNVGEDLGFVRLFLDPFDDLIEEGRPFRETNESI